MSAPTLRFDDNDGGHVVRVDLDALLRSRLLVQANSGGGKSRAIRSMLEQSYGQVQHIVLDPEGEFSTLRERFSYVLAGKEGDMPAHPKVARALSRKLLEVGASAVIDLYDLSLPERREFVKLFLLELMTLPKALWKPLLVVIDEAHFFAPQNDEAQSRDAVIALCTQGRKRGFCAVLATQRISKLHKDAAAELGNKLIGRTGLDVDMKRAGDELGMDKDGRMSLRTLEPGHFYAFGPAIGAGVQLVVTSDVVTTHPDSNTLGMIVPPPTASVQALLAKIGDLPKVAAAQEERSVALERQVRELQAQVRAKNAPVADANAIDRAVKDATRSLELRLAHRERELRAFSETASADLRNMLDQLDRMQAEPEAPPTVTTATPRAPITAPLAYPAPSTATVARADVTISNTMRRMLSVLVTLETLGVTLAEKRTMAGWAGVSHTTGTFSNQVRGMRDAGCIEVEGDRVRVTDIGRANAAATEMVTTLDELHAVWESKFSATVARMFRALLSLSGKRLRPVAKADLAAAVGVSHTTGTFSNQLREMRTPGVLEDVDKQHVRLTPLVFPEGLI